jgi:RimJ/RimL family protein N-acetyltransferase
MKSKEETELQWRTDNPQNYPGFNEPISFRTIRATDTALLTPVLKQHAKSIRGYLGSFHNSHMWDMKDAKKFVAHCVNDQFPSFHYLFFIGNRLVGIGSLHSYKGSLTQVQIVLAVLGEDLQGRGIGTTIGATLKEIAFGVWGFDKFWWLVDATNRASIKTAQKVGLSYSHSWEDEILHAEQESGLWNAFVQERPVDSPPGILQGESLEYWAEPRSASILKAVLEAKTRNSDKDSEAEK